ncbi:type II toxin-antitoxin system VapC family toxin [Amycolatopsis alkalitolerans]|uniref:Type II toxin-antitoxin system VapC family toxin n=2 Tax=Amycolatopsis alkalitolerans TaxID=2547244 RepID=A0A5C4M666_9PSEU|nr:type II toxin-antitoxin system VapC family toxin [Amycolatopsis alkalitolerans]
MLLDTCSVIDLEEIDLGELGAATDPAVSAVTIAELAYGIDIADPVERMVRTERYYGALNQFEVLPFDITAAKLYGTLAALLRQSGRDPRPRRMDLQIAATAAAHSLPLITRNGKDFAGLERAVQVITV